MKQVVSVRGPNVDDLQTRLSLMEARHRELDERLKVLERHPYLTPTEHRELAELKKQKLRAKDELMALRRGF